MRIIFHLHIYIFLIPLICGWSLIYLMGMAVDSRVLSHETLRREFRLLRQRQVVNGPPTTPMRKSRCHCVARKKFSHHRCPALADNIRRWGLRILGGDKQMCMIHVGEHVTFRHDDLTFLQSRSLTWWFYWKYLSKILLFHLTNRSI